MLLFSRDTFALVGLCLLSFSHVVAAAANITYSLTPAEALAAFPDCGRTCVVSAVANSSCNLDDVPCICGDERLTSTAYACVKLSCGLKDSLATHNISSLMCGETAEGTGYLIPVYAVFCAIAVVAVALRLLARVVTQAYFWWDDLANFLSFLCATMFTGINIKAIKLGQGKDLWSVPYDDVTEVVKMFFGDMLAYTIGRFFFRASLLLFYIRIFLPKQNKRFGRLLVGTMVFNLVYNLSFIFAVLLLCRPLPYFWTQWEGLHDGQCGSYNRLAWAAASTGIVFDMWMLALPISQLVGLTLPWQKKLMGGFMFFCGLSVVIVSLARLKTINEFTQTINPTKDIVQVCLWSGIELDVGVICPCLPSFRLLFLRAFPGSSAASQAPGGAAAGLGGSDGSSAVGGLPRKSSVESAGDPLGQGAGPMGMGNIIVNRENSVVVKHVGGYSSKESVVELLERREMKLGRR